jgi:diadenosine tetraphosphate (Ap4A) HIT family hydrolase
MKLFESDKVLAFLDIQPLSRGHAVSKHIHKQADSMKSSSFPSITVKS